MSILDLVKVSSVLEKLRFNSPANSLLGFEGDLLIIFFNCIGVSVVR